jgi:probable selenium-dependent hydroxylase accessory protein YqeC
LKKNLSEALQIPRGVTAFVGGGGKTTAIARLARELSANGRVLVATTTRVYPPELPILIDPDKDALREAFRRHAIVAVGSACGEKLGPPENLPALCVLSDYALIEADGSKGLPLKAPAAHEPVIPESARMVVALAGVDGIGRPISAVHRSELYAALVEKPLDALVTPEDVAKALLHPDGQRKGVSCPWRVLLNKADDGERLALARVTAARIAGITVIASLKSEPIFLEVWRDGACAS